MKKLQFLLSIGLLSLLTACGTSRGNMGDSGTTAGRTSGTTGTINNSTTATNSQNAATNRAGTNMSDRNMDNNVNEGQYNQRMYTSLNMNDDQIRQFESESRNALDKWRNDNPGKTMSAKDRTTNRDRILKSTLDDQQYIDYQQWSRDNPYNY